MAITGKPVDRVDGRLKVTGAAKYAAEHNQLRMAYAFPIGASIASGRITGIDKGEALKSLGFLAVLTPENALRLKAFNREELMKVEAALGEDLVPLQDNQVHYFGQFVACVVAETYEQARHAATLIKITYAADEPKIDLSTELSHGFRPERRLTEQHQPNSMLTKPPRCSNQHHVI